MSLDVVETMYAMRQLVADEITQTGRSPTGAWFYEMHPETRHELLGALVERMPWAAPVGLQKLMIDGLPVEPNPRVPKGDVWLLIGMRETKVVRVEGFTDERRRQR